ncbi:MAG: hypothetical protein KDD25_02420 [Bdellovibrionales bacterium]|nr:hypothetical protein [Bdellovibrionales bacterium]
MVEQRIGRWVLAASGLLVLALYFFQLSFAFADDEDFNVVQVQRNFKMSESGKSLHDYYINAGSHQGLQEGMVVPVERRLTIQDNYRKVIDDKVMIPVADLKIISVQEKVSIGRVVEEKSREKYGVLEFDSIMTGDKVAINRAKRIPQAVEVEVNNSKIIEPEEAPINQLTNPEMSETAPTAAANTQEESQDEFDQTGDVDMDPAADPNMRMPSSVEDGAVLKNPNPPKSPRGMKDDMTSIIPLLHSESTTR